jgi:tetratricopeptide (TPR) repeat protein
MAEKTSFPNKRAPGIISKAFRWAFFRTAALVFLLTVFLPGVCHSQPSNALALAKRVHASALALHKAHPDDLQAACALARACFDLAELTPSNTNRAALGKQGSEAAQLAVAKQPTNALAHYCLALNLGQIARTKRLSALGLVSDMEEHFELARSEDEKLDFAGPDRCLGLLYRDAPGWPISIGSRVKARQRLQRAYEISPEYPDNRLNLIESSLMWEDRVRAARDASEYEKKLPEALQHFSGEAWVGAWADWNKRWSQIHSNLNATNPALGNTNPGFKRTGE